MQIIEYWKEFMVLVGLISTYVVGRESKKIDNKKNSAIAEQEQIKVKKEDVALSILIQDSWEKLNKNVFIRLEYLEKSNEDLTHKYNDILLRNAVLEERSESYEKKYETLKKDYVKLKVDYDKVHKESKQLREEIDILKNNVL